MNRDESKIKRVTLAAFLAGSRPAGGGVDAANMLAPFVLSTFIRNYCKGVKDVSVRLLSPEISDEIYLRRLAEGKSDLFGFSCYVWNLERTLAICRKIKLVMPRAKIILGGPEVNDELFAKKILKRNNCIDFISLGEGEFIIADVIDGKPADEIESLVFRRNGKIIANKRRQLIEHLDSLPSVYDRIFLRDYEVVYYSTSRGCAGRCSYCREWSGKRVHSMQRVESDLKEIFASNSLRVLNFTDSVLDDDPVRMKEVLRICAKHNKKKIPCGGYFYFRQVDDELISLLKKAGFRYLRTGVESSGGVTLKMVGRTKDNVSRIENILPFSDTFDIVPYIITHLPGEGAAAFRAGLRKCFREGLMHGDFHCSRLRIFPGTRLCSEAAKHEYSFDQSPPHFAYSNKYLTPDEYFECRQAVVNYMIVCRMFPKEDCALFEKLGLNMIAICGSLHRKVPRCKTDIKMMSEDVITDFVETDELLIEVRDYFLSLVPGRVRIADDVKRLIKLRAEKRRRIAAALTSN